VATTAISMTGILSGALHTVVLASSGTVNLTAAQSGAICANQGTSGTTTFNLPSAAAGMKFKFVEAGNAAGELRIVPAAGDDIIGKTDASDTGTGIATSVGAGIKNTAATNVKGDFCILMAINDTDWVMVGEGGVWAAI
jgi:hypothetical protein